MVYVEKYDCYIDDDLIVYRAYDSRRLQSGKLYQCTITLNEHGYPVVSVGCKGKRRPVSIHRIVAEAFIENPLHLPTVDHINRDKGDYRISNLRWADYSEQNNNRGFVIESQRKYKWRGSGRESRHSILRIARLQCREYRKTHTRAHLPSGERRFVPIEHTICIPYNVPVGFKRIIKPEYMYLYTGSGESQN